VNDAPIAMQTAAYLVLCVLRDDTTPRGAASHSITEVAGVIG